jgi:hypothetical protein
MLALDEQAGRAATGGTSILPQHERRPQVNRTAGHLLVLTLAALSLGLSFAHVMEMPPRLSWAPRLWLDATTFGGLYAPSGGSVP